MTKFLFAVLAVAAIPLFALAADPVAPKAVLAPNAAPCAQNATSSCQTAPGANFGPLAGILAAEPLGMGAPVRTFLGLGGRCGFLKHRRGKC